MPGSLCRCGPAKETGEARIDHTGSTRMLRSRGLDQPGDVADERQPHLVAANARRRRIAVGIRHPVRPARALAVGAELPAQHFTERFRRHPVGIEEARAVKMVGDGAVIGFHIADPDRGHADGRGGPGEHSKNTAAGDGHGGITKGGRERKTWGVIWRVRVELGTCGERKPAPPATGDLRKMQLCQSLTTESQGHYAPSFSLTFAPSGRLTPALSRKDVLFDPPPGP